LSYIFGKTLNIKQVSAIHSRPLSNYTVNHKKRDILFLTITLASLNRFL